MSGRVELSVEQREEIRAAAEMKPIVGEVQFGVVEADED